MKESVYVMAMEIGSEFPDGITFDELIEKIEKKSGKTISINAKYGLVEWFVEAFTTDDRIRASSHKPFETYRTMIPSYFRDKRDFYLPAFQDFQRAKFVLSGKTFKQYIDYLELKESREQALKANRTAKVSIWIAMITLLASTIIPLFSKPIPQPPFEVEVIDDKTQNQALELEIRALKEELQRVETLIQTYKSDTLND
ncbi:hypothetical protein [Flagellimonas oceanensis]|uniref:hypothetical protein n=1 Tax=Flagellimonas oceanensis TaxID=2499163 RepID=UPI000F8F3A23|nr:hypothetical protein [Allomuricauda oceanensis]